MLHTYISVFIFLFITSAGAVPRRLNPQCRSNVCDDRPECPRTTCRCIFASRMDCAIYYQCVNGKPYQYRCSPGLLFNADTLSCDYSNKVKCPFNASSSSSTEAITTTTTFTLYTATPTEIITSKVTENADTTIKTSPKNLTTTTTEASTSETTEEPTTTETTEEPTTTETTEEPTTTETTEEPTTTEKTEEPTTETTEEPTTTETTEEPTTTETTEEPTTREETSESPTTTVFPSESIKSSVISTREVTEDSTVTKLTTSSIFTINSTSTSPEINTTTEGIPSTKFSCPTRFGLYADPNSCYRFYHCSHWIPYHKWCPSSLHFNPKLRVCDWPYRAGCDSISPATFEPITPATLNPNSTFGTCDCEYCQFPVPGDCSAYVFCINGVATTMHCGPDLFFNPMTGTCDFSENVHCIKDNIQCPEPSGRSLLEGSCSYFVECHNGKQKIRQCPEGLQFNQSSEMCSWSGSCSGQKPGGGSTSKIVVDASICNGCDYCFKPYTADCSHYIRCFQDIATEERCPPGLFFNSATEMCDHDYNVQCSGPQPQPECPELFGYFPHPEDCGKYLQCINGSAIVKTCPGVLHFDPLKKHCDWPWAARCREDSGFYPTSAPNTNITDCNCDCCLKPTGSDCMSFILCINKVGFAKSCSSGLRFNPQTENCDFGENVDCPIMPEVPAYYCPEYQGLFPHPEECSKFIHCAHGFPYVKDCPSNLHFNPNLKVCDWPYSAGCQGFPTSAPIIDRSDLPCDICDSCFIPDESDCAAYTYCLNGTGHKLRCTESLLFNPNTEACDLPSNVNCPNQPSSQCPSPNGLFPANECSQFIHCSNGIAYLKNCPEGLHFNPQALVCDWPENANCGEIPVQPTPPEDNDSDVMNRTCDCDCCFLPHENDCSKYILCLDGYRHVGQCSRGLLFNPNIQNCDLAERVTCGGVSPLCPQPNGLFPDGKECTSYIKCSGGISKVAYCNNGMHFSAERKQCLDPCKASCDSSYDCETTVHISSSTPVVSSSTTSPYCPENDGLFPNSEDCSSFYQCSGGRAYLIKCPSGLHFSSEQLVCDYPCEAKCNSSIDCEPSTTPPPPECQEGDALFPNNDDCSSFYKCHGGKYVLTNCPSGLHFSYRHQVCEYPCEAKCNASDDCDFFVSTISPYCRESNGLFPNEDDCSSFYKCSNGRAYLTVCPPGLHFSEEYQVCDYPCKAKCNTSIDCNSPSPSPTTTSTHPSSSTLSPYCLEREGLFPDEDDCTSFYMCSGGRAYLIQCPPGLHFSKEYQVCEYPCEANCNKTLDCGSTSTAEVITSTPSPYCPERDGLFPNRNDCTTFYKCSSGKAYLTNCPSGLHFSSEHQACEYPCEAKCNASLTCTETTPEIISSTPSPHCPSPEGLYPVLNDCSAFHLCSDGKEYLIHCPPGLHFSQVHETCEEPCTAKCNMSLVCGTSPKPVSSTPHPLSPECVEPDGLFPNPKDCGSFYQCSNGRSHLIQCPTGLHFSIDDAACERPCVAGCDLSIDCPPEIPETKGNCTCEACYLPDPNDCSAFYFCDQGILTKGYCPFGTLFSKTSSVCEDESIVDCEANGDPSMCPERYGFFPYPGDCKKFVHCDNGVAHVRECQEGLEYDPLSRMCTKPKGYCGETVLDPNCSEPTGLFPDPKNCSVFYHCEHGVAYPKGCSSPLMFNPEKGVCDWPDNVACGKEVGSSTTSTTTIPSIGPVLNISTATPSIPPSPPTSECYDVPGVICPCACRVPTYDECSSYFQCQEDGTACKKFCPEGLYFNKREMVCDLPENVECRDFFFTFIRRAKSMSHNLRR